MRGVQSSRLFYYKLFYLEKQGGIVMLQGNYSESDKRAVWNKAKTIQNMDSTMWRKDPIDALIRWDNFGDTSSDFGWEIDHKKPLAKGGSNNLANLEALQWKNNLIKGDDYPICQAIITSSGNINIEKEQVRVVISAN